MICFPAGHRIAAYATSVVESGLQLKSIWFEQFCQEKWGKIGVQIWKIGAGCCGAKLFHSEQLSGNVKSRGAPSEADRPQGQQGHAKSYPGGIWTSSCPPASLSI